MNDVDMTARRYQHLSILLLSRRRVQLGCLGLLLVVCFASSFSTAFTSIFYSPRYYRDMALAHSGIQHLHQAQRLLLSLQDHPLNQESIHQAQNEFMGAAQDFGQLRADMQTLPSFVFDLPFAGASLHTLQHLVPLADDFSRAGDLGCQMVQEVMSILRSPAEQKQSALWTRKMLLLTSDLYTIHRLVRSGLHELDQVQPGETHLGAQVDTQLALLRQYEPQFEVWLTLLERALPFLPDLLGTNQPAQYFLEMLDSSELRPGGGFIGNYGSLTFVNGRLQKAQIADVSLLDLPFKAAGGLIPFPPEYRWFPLAHGKWSLRDSNLDADFPTSARFGLRNFQLEGGNMPMQGVVAITPMLIQHMLEITGPIAIPAYHDTITAQNLIARIHYYQLGAGRRGSSLFLSSDGLSSQRKHFTALLADAFFSRLRHLSNGEMAKMTHLLLDSLQTKDIQLYFPQNEVEALLRQARIDASIQQAPDGLLVVDANVSGNKANSFIRSTVTDVVHIDAAGNALHSLTLRYSWTLSGNVFGNPLYQAYIQVYAPANSLLQDQMGWDQAPSTLRSGHVVWAGAISMLYGDSRTILLSWIVPHSVQSTHSGGMHFLYLVQQQAGIERDLRLQVYLPACAHLTGTSGATLVRTPQTLTLTQTLTRNVLVGIDYSCR
ncbi:MAG TPA: DUF4012 domain-containing protein [Ktedonobacteraceae bacterium]|nr:DUF4012 domain-containing protein [Ktedonobacteraceae bacterium]